MAGHNGYRVDYGQKWLQRGVLPDITVTEWIMARNGYRVEYGQKWLQRRVLPDVKTNSRLFWTIIRQEEINMGHHYQTGVN